MTLDESIGRISKRFGSPVEDLSHKGGIESMIETKNTNEIRNTCSVKRIAVATIADVLRVNKVEITSTYILKPWKEAKLMPSAKTRIPATTWRI